MPHTDQLIGENVEHLNKYPYGFVRTKKAGDILAKVRRPRTALNKTASS